MWSWLNCLGDAELSSCCTVNYAAFSGHLKEEFQCFIQKKIYEQTQADMCPCFSSLADFLLD